MRASILLSLAAIISLLIPLNVSALAADYQITERVRVVYASPDMEKAVEIYLPAEQPRAIRSRGQLGMLSVAIRNRVNQSLRLEYKVDWFDEEGFPINAVGGWQTLLLSPNQESNLRSVAQEPGAASARITMRDPARI